MDTDKLIDRYLEGRATKEEVSKLDKILVCNPEAAEDLLHQSFVETALRHGNAGSSTRRTSSSRNGAPRKPSQWRFPVKILMAAAAVVLVSLLGWRLMRIPKEFGGAQGESQTSGSSMRSQSTVTAEAYQVERSRVARAPDQQVEEALSFFQVSENDLDIGLVSGIPDIREVMDRLNEVYALPEFGGGAPEFPEFEYELKGPPGYRMPLDLDTVARLPKSTSIFNLARFYGALSGYDVNLAGNTLKFAPRAYPTEETQFRIEEVAAKKSLIKPSQLGTADSEAVSWKDPGSPEFGSSMLLRSSRLSAGLSLDSPGMLGYGFVPLVEEEGGGSWVADSVEIYLADNDLALIKDLSGGIHSYVTTKLFTLPKGSEITTNTFSELEFEKYWREKIVPSKVEIFSAPSLATRNGLPATVEVADEFGISGSKDTEAQWIGFKFSSFVTTTGKRVNLIADADLRELSRDSDSPDVVNGIRVTKVSLRAMLLSGSTIVAYAGSDKSGHPLGLAVTVTMIDKSGARVNAPEISR